MQMTVGRDYRLHGRYEYVLYEGEKIVAREGFYTTSTAAKRAGMKKAKELQS